MPVTADSLHARAADVDPHVDENTIAVGAHARHDLHRPDDDRGDRRRGGQVRAGTAGTSRSTSMRQRRLRRAVHSARSEVGLPPAERCGRSTSRTTSTGSSTPASARSSSATEPTCPTSWSSTSATSAATMPNYSPQLLSGRATAVIAPVLQLPAARARRATRGCQAMVVNAQAPGRGAGSRPARSTALHDRDRFPVVVVRPTEPDPTRVYRPRRTPPRARLDRPGVLAAAERRGGRGAAHGRQGELQPRHGRPAARRPAPGARRGSTQVARGRAGEGRESARRSAERRPRPTRAGHALPMQCLSRWRRERR